MRQRNASFYLHSGNYYADKKSLSAAVFVKERLIAIDKSHPDTVLFMFLFQI
ncbi:hypothetical protein DSUL_90099 [Desulfovibrionales bacterium]